MSFFDNKWGVNQDGFGFVPSIYSTPDGQPYVANGSVQFYLRNLQRDAGSTPTTYQRVTTANDVTEAGVPPVHHVFNDLVNDTLTTGALPSGTYEVARCDKLGNVTYDTVSHPGGAGINLLGTVDRLADVAVRSPVFTAPEKARIDAYWGARYAA